SARFVFGHSLGDPLADVIWRAGLKSTEGLTRSEIWSLIGHSRAQADLDRALSLLEGNQMARRTTVDTGGRPAERWQFDDGAWEKREIREESPDAEANAGTSFPYFPSFPGRAETGEDHEQHRF